jgi:hypothetical protein
MTNMNYFYGITTLILTLMTVSASPQPKPNPSDTKQIQVQKATVSKQKDCIENINSKQQKIVNELSKIKDLIKKD